jgi:hypothetical protein
MYPIKYPIIAPKTENIIAIKEIFKNSFLFAIIIGISIASVGIGKIKLSKKATNAKIVFANLCPAHSTDL